MSEGRDSGKSEIRGEQIVVYEVNQVGVTGPVLTDSIEDAKGMVVEFLDAPVNPAINTLLDCGESQ